MADYNHNTNQILLKKGLELLKVKEDGYGQKVGRLEDGNLGLTNNALNKSMVDFAKKVFEAGTKRSLTIIYMPFVSMDPSSNRLTKERGINIKLPEVFNRDFSVIRNALHVAAKKINAGRHLTEIILTEPDMSDLVALCMELAALLRDDIKSDTSRSHTANILLQILADIYPGDERHLLLQYNTYEKENAAGFSFITEFTKDDPRLVVVH